MTKYDELIQYSNPEEVYRKLQRYYPNTALYISNRSDKKYMVQDPTNNKFVHFGAMGYQDFTKHGNHKRRERYLQRALHIHGNWKNNPYSPNVLSILLLW